MNQPAKVTQIISITTGFGGKVPSRSIFSRSESSDGRSNSDSDSDDFDHGALVDRADHRERLSETDSSDTNCSFHGAFVFSRQHPMSKYRQVQSHSVGFCLKKRSDGSEAIKLDEHAEADAHSMGDPE